MNTQLVTRGSRIRRLLAKAVRGYRSKVIKPSNYAAQKHLVNLKQKYRRWGLNPYQKPGRKN